MFYINIGQDARHLRVNVKIRIEFKVELTSDLTGEKDKISFLMEGSTRTCLLRTVLKNFPGVIRHSNYVLQLKSKRTIFEKTFGYICHSCKNVLAVG